MHTNFFIKAANRRRRRTEERLEAVSFQLQQVLDEFELDVCLLTDSVGAVLTSAQTSTQALGRVISIIRAPVQRGEDMLRREFYLEGSRLCLTLVGPNVGSHQAAFERAIVGINRIHATTQCTGMRADLQVLADEGLVLA